MTRRGLDLSSQPWWSYGGRDKTEGLKEESKIFPVCQEGNGFPGVGGGEVKCLFGSVQLSGVTRDVQCSDDWRKSKKFSGFLTMVLYLFRCNLLGIVRVNDTCSRCLSCHTSREFPQPLASPLRVFSSFGPSFLPFTSSITSVTQH